MNENILIFPAVRRWVARIARFGVWVAVLCAAAAALEPLSMVVGVLPAAVLAGCTATVLAALLLSLLLLSACWCHLVLLAGRGVLFTRYLLPAVLPVAVLMPVCRLYSLLTDSPLLARQTDMPLICSTALVVSVLCNIPRARAAEVRMSVSVTACAVFSFLCAMTDMPQTVLLNDLCMLAFAACAVYPLNALSRYAPTVVSLPEAD